MKKTLVVIGSLLVAALAFAEVQSGLPVGAGVPAYNPQHVAGPLKGTTTCFVWVNGAAPSVQIFAKAGANTASLAEKLEKLVAANGKLVGLVNVVDGTKEDLEKLAAEKNLSKIALCYSTNKGDLGSYKINAEATNTIIVYKGKKVTANFSNLEAKDFSKLEEAVKSVLQ